MNIREYQANDFGALAELMGELGYPTSHEQMKKRMEHIQSDPMYNTFVAELNGQIVGMLGARQAYFYEEDGLATQIMVIVMGHDYRGRGIGKALMQYVEAWARGRGSNIIFLTSGMKEERIPAHKLYQSMGFEINGYRFVKLK